MDKEYNRIILPKSLDKGTSYRTAVWVANSIFTRTGIPVVYGHTCLLYTSPSPRDRG